MVASLCDDCFCYSRILCVFSRQYQQQIITIVPTHRENASDVIDGLKYVKYTVYPTQSNLHYIAHLTAPLHIHNTCSLPAVIPEFLKSLCRRPIDQMS